MKKIEWIAEESGMTQYVAPNNKFLFRFAHMIIVEANKQNMASTENLVVCLQQIYRALTNTYPRDVDVSKIVLNMIENELRDYYKETQQGQLQ